MPHTRHAKKTLRQNEKRRQANKTKRSAMRTYVRRVQAAAEAGDKEAALRDLPIAQKHIDKAAKSRVIHPNAASRQKSALARKVASI